MLKHSVYHRVQNRRRSQRYPVGWRARVTSRGRGTLEVQLSDVSGDGLQFYSLERFRVGERVDLDVYTSWRSFFRADATIIRVGKRTRSGQEIGIRFDRMAELDRAVLDAGLRALGWGSSTARACLLTEPQQDSTSTRGTIETPRSAEPYLRTL